MAASGGTTRAVVRETNKQPGPERRERRPHRASHHLHPERQERADGRRGYFIGLPDAWELQYFGTTIYGPTQDNDKDGANNLAEWAFNLNPTRPDIAALTPGTGTAGLPVARLTGSAGNQRLTIEFVRRKNAALTYTVQFANTPAGASFLSAVNAPSVTPIDAYWERVVVDDNVTIGDQAIRFGRVRMTAP